MTDIYVFVVRRFNSTACWSHNELENYSAESSDLGVLPCRSKHNSIRMEVLAPKETAPQHGGTSGDNLVIHPHLLKPRLKPSAATADFTSQLRQYATSKQGRNLAQEYVVALGKLVSAVLC